MAIGAAAPKRSCLVLSSRVVAPGTARWSQQAGVGEVGQEGRYSRTPSSDAVI
jgi:hypothetical protein